MTFCVWLILGIIVLLVHDARISALELIARCSPGSNAYTLLNDAQPQNGKDWRVRHRAFARFIKTSILKLKCLPGTGRWPFVYGRRIVGWPTSHANGFFLSLDCGTVILRSSNLLPFIPDRRHVTTRARCLARIWEIRHQRG